jgi:hypothetical protein
MKRFIWTGLALQLCAASAFGQSTPATTPSSPPVTTPPPAGANPPTGGPNSWPTAEPANAIDTGKGVTPGANSFTEAQAKSRLERNGYSQVSQLTKDPSGIWRGSATRNGAQMHVAVDYRGHIASN